MHQFDQDISVVQQDRLLFTAQVSNFWSVNNTPNGGYLMALVANAMLQNSTKRSTPIVNANYVSRCTSEKADIMIEEFSQSTQFSRFQAKLLQEGNEKLRAIGTFVEEKKECFLESYESKEPEISPLEKCMAIPQLPGLTLMNHLDISLDPTCAQWMQGVLSDRSEMKGWIRFKSERPHDLPSILFFMDCFPPPVFASQGMMAWVPTIELSVNVRKIPNTRWLKGYFRSRFITCGLVESDGEMWDEDGNLVAISRQIAQFRRSST